MQPPHVNASSHNEYVHLCLPGSLAVTADDLDLVCRDLGLVVQLECNILDQERPNFVAESVGIEVTLKDGEEEHKRQPCSSKAATQTPVGL